MSDDLSSEFNETLEELYSEVEAAMRSAGESAVEYNVENGDYNNITGRLRRSNYYEIRGGERPEELVIGNSAPYASMVEARGRMVITGGVLVALKELEELTER